MGHLTVRSKVKEPDGKTFRFRDVYEATPFMEDDNVVDEHEELHVVKQSYTE